MASRSSSPSFRDGVRVLRLVVMCHPPSVAPVAPLAVWSAEDSTAASGAPGRAGLCWRGAGGGTPPRARRHRDRQLHPGCPDATPGSIPRGCTMAAPARPKSSKRAPAAAPRGAAAKTPLPYTGQEFLDSLDDGREVWIYGSRVKKITTHPAFQNCARMIARLYDALHEDHASGRNVLTGPSEWGGFTQRYFRAPPTVGEQGAARDAIAQWARVTYGRPGRA